MGQREDLRRAQRALDEVEERETRIDEIIERLKRHQAEADRQINEAHRIQEVAREQSRRRGGK